VEVDDGRIRPQGADPRDEAVPNRARPPLVASMKGA